MVAGVVNKEVDRRSLQKLVMLIERKERAYLVMYCVLDLDGAETEKRRA